jgi:hypothetical protein
VAKVLSKSGKELTVSVTVRLEGTLLEMEQAIREATNEVGCCATEEALKCFDTDGSPIRVGPMKLTARGRDPKRYQTPYGVAEVERYVYQTSHGGRIYCPLEERARIIRGATPLFASQLSHKYAQLNVRAVQRDLEENHGRKVAASYIQNVSEWVGTIAEAKEEDWEYELPALAEGIATVAVSLDGAMIPMADSEGYREAMVGTLSFYDRAGERRHTVYLGAAPEYGKQTFNERLAREIERAKQHYPEARYVGIADGAVEQLDLPRSTHRPPADRLLPRHRVHRQARPSALAETRQRGLRADVADPAGVGIRPLGRLEDAVGLAVGIPALPIADHPAETRLGQQFA